MNTLTRRARLTLAGLVLMGLSLACGSAAQPASQPPQPSAANAAGAKSEEAKRPSDSPLSQEPLTLLADPPAPDARPAEPVSTRGWLGVALGPDPKGAVVDRVVPGSPAKQAGLETGDVITSVAGEPIKGPSDVVRIVAQHEKGERLPIGLVRDGEARLLPVVLAGRPVDSDITRMSFVGQPAPELGVLKTVKGSVTPTLQALRGKVVVLEFWASWCAVCRFMVPTLNEWQARFGPQGAVVLGVTVDSVTVASTAANQLGMSYSLASDHEGTATQAYAANAIPTLFIIDKKGTVREVIIGYSEAELAQAEALIDRLLAGS